MATHLTSQQHAANIEAFNKLLLKFGDRSENLVKLYQSFGDHVYTAPAASITHYHNAFPGGYVDHVLRVVRFSKQFYQLWSSLGMDVSDFTLEELMFAALNHDLGKLGLPGEGNHGYEPNPSQWHRDNLGQMYKPNTNIPFATVVDKTFFILQKFNVPYSLNEFYAIKLHDGLYEEANKPYYFSNTKESKLRTNIAFILHQADLTAARYEFEAVNGDTLKKLNL